MLAQFARRSLSKSKVTEGREQATFGEIVEALGVQIT